MKLHDNARWALQHVVVPGAEKVQDVGGPPVTFDAARFVLACILQENKDLSRYQVLESGGAGPARGFAQFERAGATIGVLQHRATRGLAAAVCTNLRVVPVAQHVWRALEGNDVLAGAFARLLVYTDPYTIPDAQEPAWECYAKRLWRPGKPHPETWAQCWMVATEVTKEMVAP